MVNKNKEIEALAKDICDDIEAQSYCRFCKDYCDCQIAKAIYEAGYRKQIEGEWIDMPFPNNPNWEPNKKCSICGRVVRRKMENYCPRCGAKMKEED